MGKNPKIEILGYTPISEQLKSSGGPLEVGNQMNDDYHIHLVFSALTCWQKEKQPAVIHWG
ncbi:hypothetical protein STRCR_0771 [Streptococcus criceti HS-6]|uniref:Uncharacterized protein n=1 Tax=Streptococcus criceti HS-6 TaxID=873449 RepID=G5JRR3_STRCG|nr:hypothetical protein [Streptococcus criceti]EHI74305.1 hypothetical protein STRCR_0771 [Streptococcus criceti HS-6]